MRPTTSSTTGASACVVAPDARPRGTRRGAISSTACASSERSILQRPRSVTATSSEPSVRVGDREHDGRARTAGACTRPASCRGARAHPRRAGSSSRSRRRTAPASRRRRRAARRGDVRGARCPRTCAGVTPSIRTNARRNASGETPRPRRRPRPARAGPRRGPRCIRQAVSTRPVQSSYRSQSVLTSSCTAASYPIDVSGPARYPVPGRSAHPLMRRGPGQELVRRPGVDDPLHRDAGLGGPGAAVGLPLELADGVGVGVDRHLAAGVDDQLQQPHRRVEALGPAVDLDGLVEVRGRREHQLVVELRLRSTLAEHEAAGAVAEDVDVAGSRAR